MSRTKSTALKLKIIFLVLVSMTLSSVHAHAALTQNDISQLYVSIFNRASEGGGNAWWQANYNDKTIAANAMLESEDAKNYFGDALDSDLAFIKHIYKNTLNKTYADDPGGINYWVDELNKGKSRGEVVAAMVGVIKEYAPGGQYHIPNDPVTIAAYNQFTNRVNVSNYMADTVQGVPVNWETTTRFAVLGGLNVTFDPATVDTAKQAINIFAGSPAGLEDDIEYFMAMVTSAGDLSPVMDEIGTLLMTIMIAEDTSVVTITPPLDSINPNNPPSTINIAANFGNGYTPEGTSAVYTGSATIDITGIAFTHTGISANATMIANNVMRDGEPVLNGNLTMGLNAGMSQDLTINSLTANVNFSNLTAMDIQANGGMALNAPGIGSESQLTQPVILTLNQFSTLDYQMNGTVTMTQAAPDTFDTNFNITTDQGPVSGVLQAQVNIANPDQIFLSTPSGPLSVGTATLVINQVTMDTSEDSTCTDLPVSGNIVVTRGAETSTINFSNCTYTVN